MVGSTVGGGGKSAEVLGAASSPNAAAADGNARPRPGSPDVSRKLLELERKWESHKQGLTSSVAGASIGETASLVSMETGHGKHEIVTGGLVDAIPSELLLTRRRRYASS